MPGYEPYLLCDFHVHTRWSDGRLSLREVVDLYGTTRRFDVIAITDHIVMKRDLLARAARMATLGRREFSVTEGRFQAYLEDIASEARRARRLYDLLVVPGAEITQNLDSWKTLVRCEKTWEAVARALRSNVDVALTLYRNGPWAA